MFVRVFIIIAAVSVDAADVCCHCNKFVQFMLCVCTCLLVVVPFAAGIFIILSKCQQLTANEMNAISVNFQQIRARVDSYTHVSQKVTIQTGLTDKAYAGITANAWASCEAAPGCCKQLAWLSKDSEPEHSALVQPNNHLQYSDKSRQLRASNIKISKKFGKWK